jgi:NAD(P)H-hydrate epimerase
MVAIEKGSKTPLNSLIDSVGEQVAAFITKHGFRAPLIITGAGNNGSDGYATVLALQRRSIPTAILEALPTHDTSRKERYHALGGCFIQLEETTSKKFDCVVDAIFGIGYKIDSQKEWTEELALIFEWIKNKNLPVISIDTPSGLDCTTGATKNCIKATATLYCQYPKLGMFLQNGFEYVGALQPVTLPLSDGALATSSLENYFLLEHEDIPPLPKIARCQNKYSRGSSIGIGGSYEMPGAAILAAFASLKIGSGIVRLLTPSSALFAACPPEVVRIGLDPSLPEQWSGKLPKKLDAAFIGPGLGRSSDVLKLLTHLVPLLPQKIVVDADALYYFTSIFHTLNLPTFKKKLLLTPHDGEMAHLLQKEKFIRTEASLKEVQSWVEQHNVTLLLKGCPTILFHPNMPTYVMTEGTPALATAGSGDVLTGILTGLLAQGLEPHQAAILGSWLHGRAGILAAAQKSPYSVTASTLLDFLSDAIKEQIGHACI